MLSELPTPMEAMASEVMKRLWSPSRAGTRRPLHWNASELSSARPMTRRAATSARVSASPIEDPGPARSVIEGALSTFTARTTRAGRTARTPRRSRNATQPSQYPQAQMMVERPTMKAHWTK